MVARAGLEIQCGDTVQRRSGRKVTGTVLRIWDRTSQYGQERRIGERFYYVPPGTVKRMAQVRWHGASPRWSGNNDIVTKVQLSSLKQVER